MPRNCYVIDLYKIYFVLWITYAKYLTLMFTESKLMLSQGRSGIWIAPPPLTPYVVGDSRSPPTLGDSLCLMPNLCTLPSQRTLSRLRSLPLEYWYRLNVKPPVRHPKKFNSLLLSALSPSPQSSIPSGLSRRAIDQSLRSGWVKRPQGHFPDKVR